MINFENKSRYGLDDLEQLIALLRAPGGCPWDAEQTHESLRRNMLEEAYEAVEAIDERDADHLKEELGELAGKVMFSFGAGGTGRSVCFELANAGAKRIYICSRSDACEKLCGELDKYYPGICVPIRAADEDAVAKALEETDIILNLSGAGMRGKEDSTCVDKKYLKPEHICFDATYNPPVTRFLKEAAEIGCKTINGLDMSLYQGIRQIELWTNNECAPLEAMRKELMDIMAEQTK